MGGKLKENWKAYLVYALLVVAAVIWIAVSGREDDAPKDKEYLEKLRAMDYMDYAVYGDGVGSYARLSAEYGRQGYQGADAVIILEPGDAAMTEGVLLETGVAGFEGEALHLGENVDVNWEFQVEQAGLYNIVVEYAGVDGDGAKIQRSLLLDGKLPCEEAANIHFYRYFVETEDVKVNEIGDEVWPEQEEVLLWMTQAVYDAKGLDPQPMSFYLEEGAHTLSLNYVDQPWAVRQVRLEGKQDLPSYEEVKSQYQARGYQKVSVDAGAYMEGEESSWRNDSIIRRERNGDPMTVPFSLQHRVLNTVEVPAGPGEDRA